MKNSRSIVLLLATFVMVGVVAVLIWMIVGQVATPIQFEKHFEERSNEVIEKEQHIIKLVQAYRDNNPKKEFTTNWDELIDFALNGEVQFRSQIYDEYNLGGMVWDEVKQDSVYMESFAEIRERELKKDKNWKNERVVTMPARDTIFNDARGNCRLTEEAIRNLRYIPYTDNTIEFQLDTATYEAGAYRTHLIRCHAPYVTFIDTKTYSQEFWNMLNDQFELFVNHQEANEDMKKMKADGIKASVEKEEKYMIGNSHPIPMDIEFFGISFGSLEEPTNEAMNIGW